MGYWDEVWENIWQGWTPVIMVSMFLAGFKMAKTFANLGVSNLTTILAYLLGCIGLPLVVPMFSTFLKNKK